MDFDMGEGVGALRGLRQLVKEHVPADFLGAFTDDPADLEVAQRFCRLLAEQGLLCLAWPEEFGGRGASAWEQTVVREEMWAHHEPRGAQYMGSTGWARDHAARDRRAAAPAPAADRAGRGDLVPGLQRAGRWLGSGLPADGGRAGRRRMADLGPEDLDLVRPDGPVVLPAHPHRRRRPKQQGITVFLVPMSDPAIEVRPIASMIGPAPPQRGLHRRPLGDRGGRARRVNEGWTLVQEVLAFERVGIARYARCERLLKGAGRAGRRVGTAPEELRSPLGPHARALPAGPAARLPGGGACRSAATSDPADAAGYRIAVTRLDQESAEVLADIVGGSLVGSRARGSGGGRGPLALFARGHGGLRQHRDAADPPRPVPAGGVVRHRTERGGPRVRPGGAQALQSAGGDPLVQLAEQEPARRELARGALGTSGPGSSTPRRTATSWRRPPPLCRSAGCWAVPYPVAERLARPADLDVGRSRRGLRRPPAGAVACLDLRLARSAWRAAAHWPRPGPSAEPPARQPS